MSLYAKTITAAVLQAAIVVATWYLTGQWNAEEWGLTFMGILTALGVYAVPNQPPH